MVLCQIGLSEVLSVARLKVGAKANKNLHTFCYSQGKISSGPRNSRRTQSFFLQPNKMDDFITALAGVSLAAVMSAGGAELYEAHFPPVPEGTPPHELMRIKIPTGSGGHRYMPPRHYTKALTSSAVSNEWMMAGEYDRSYSIVAAAHALRLGYRYYNYVDGNLVCHCSDFSAIVQVVHRKILAARRAAAKKAAQNAVMEIGLNQLLVDDGVHQVPPPLQVQPSLVPGDGTSGDGGEVAHGD